MTTNSSLEIRATVSLSRPGMCMNEATGFEIKNNYGKEVFNGDVGKISKLDLEMQEMKIRFDDRVVVYEYPNLDELVLAYAVSIHKSQGSDYPAVIMSIRNSKK